MRTEPTLRIPLGILALLAGLAVYAGVVVLMDVRHDVDLAVVGDRVVCGHRGRERDAQRQNQGQKAKELIHGVPP